MTDGQGQRQGEGRKEGLLMGYFSDLDIYIQYGDVYVIRTPAGPATEIDTDTLVLWG